MPTPKERLTGKTSQIYVIIVLCDTEAFELSQWYKVTFNILKLHEAQTHGEMIGQKIVVEMGKFVCPDS